MPDDRIKITLPTLRRRAQPDFDELLAKFEPEAVEKLIRMARKDHGIDLSWLRDRLFKKRNGGAA